MMIRDKTPKQKDWRGEKGKYYDYGVEDERNRIRALIKKFVPYAYQKKILKELENENTNKRY